MRLKIDDLRKILTVVCEKQVDFAYMKIFSKSLIFSYLLIIAQRWRWQSLVKFKNFDDRPCPGHNLSLSGRIFKCLGHVCSWWGGVSPVRPRSVAQRSRLLACFFTVLPCKKFKMIPFYSQSLQSWPSFVTSIKNLSCDFNHSPSPTPGTLTMTTNLPLNDLI